MKIFWILFLISQVYCIAELYSVSYLFKTMIIVAIVIAILLIILTDFMESELEARDEMIDEAYKQTPQFIKLYQKELDEMEDRYMEAHKLLENNKLRTIKRHQKYNR